MIRLVVEMPPSANRYWRWNPRGGMYISEEAADYKTDVALTARIQGCRVPIEGAVRLTATFYRARRTGDLDNRLKVLLDALSGVAYLDDKQIVEIHAYQEEDKARPRVEISVEKIDTRTGGQDQ